MDSIQVDEMLKRMAETESKDSHILTENLDKQITNTLYNLDNIKIRRTLPIKLALCMVISIFILISIYPQKTMATIKTVFSLIQKGVTWNPEKKEYYNSDSFTWDSTNKIYIPIIKFANQKLSSTSYTPEDEKQWLTQNQNSKNSVDIAIIEFNKKIKEENLKKPNLSSACLSIDDDAYSVFSNLNINDLNEMLTRIKNNAIFSDLLKIGVQKMTKVKDSELIISDNEKWLKVFNSKISSAGTKIKDYSEKIKSGVDNQTQTQIDTDIQSYGIFAVPYLMDEINNGNDQMIKYLPSLLDNYCNDSKENLAKKDKSYWQSWSENHKDDMDELKKLTKVN